MNGENSSRHLGAEARLVDSLAERLYTTHREWCATLSEGDQAWVRWWALDEDLKLPYRAAAGAMIDGER